MITNESIEIMGRIESFLNRTIGSELSISMNQQTFSKLMESCKQLLDIIEVLKLEKKSYTSIMETNKVIQQKLNNHNNIIQSVENSFNDRIKGLTEENKVLRDQFEKQKKSYQDRYENVDKELEQLKAENCRLNQVIEDLKEQISQLREVNNKNVEIVLEKENNIHKLTALSNFEKLGDPESSSLQSVLVSKLNSKIIQYLHPKQIKEILLSNRMIRQSVLNNYESVRQIFRVINKTNRNRTKFLQRHVKHFDQSCEKISEEIIQTAFYKYMILKKNIGAYMLSILSECALLFEGKFVDNLEQMPNIDTSLVELEKYQDFPVDSEIKEMYKQELIMENKMISDEVYTLYQKIHNTAQLYSADVESIGLFLNNLENNYSKLFVFSKKLCTEAKHMQMLNTYLIKMLVDRQHFEITKNSEIQDIKAQLQSESKIKNFFSSKSFNSEQRCLTLENQKLNLQMKLKDLSQRFYDLEQSKKREEEEGRQLDKKNQILIKDNKLFKQNFDQVHTKYTKIMQELEVLRNNLQKMNLSI